MGEAKEMEVKRGRKGAGEWGADPGERVGPAWASCADGADSELNLTLAPGLYRERPVIISLLETVYSEL